MWLLNSILFLSCQPTEEPLQLKDWRQAESQEDTHGLVSREMNDLDWKGYIKRRALFRDITTSEHVPRTHNHYYVQQNALNMVARFDDLSLLKETAFSQEGRHPADCKRTPDTQWSLDLVCYSWFLIELGSCTILDPEDNYLHLKNDPVCHQLHPDFDEPMPPPEDWDSPY